ncbi:MAG TPA: 2-isopropylmalate synthase [Pseudonocardiaceae bacterium]|nr:2-isopropylmalate synthase [Pseudonocardiaceae bacterium]
MAEVGAIEQPWWNPQSVSPMPAHRYVRPEERLPGGLPDRTWPEREIARAPLWASVDLRDGNQALANPMDIHRKGRMFDLLVRLGFKEIEVGYPAASETDFAFIQSLVHQDRIPDDVTISVFTPAKLDLIDRTFAAIRGADHAVVHLCMATACLWRDVVFEMSAIELREFTMQAAGHVARLADGMPDSRLRFEYSPETFNVTEPDFALAVSNSVAASVWDACPDRPVTLNLPSTVETDSPNVYADQIEWMHRGLERRDSIILSVHPHNDRGTAVASAELAVAAGADRVEGTLFGNGERTGNVCLVTLALNLFSRGVDPQLDFSDIDDVRRHVEECNQMPVHARHPYVGDLVYTAFSGTHQDAIAKGLRALDVQAERAGVPVSGLPWQVPYLPIDPKDVGRTYESVVRVNSQSGKGGVAHVLRDRYGLDLPRDLRVEFARAVQRVTDDSGLELTSLRLWELFRDEYLTQGGGLRLKEARERQQDAGTRLDAVLVAGDGREIDLTGTGPTRAAALTDAFTRAGFALDLLSLTDHTVADRSGTRTAAYAHISMAGTEAHGAGLDPSPAIAALHSALSAVNRATAESLG